MILMSDPEDDVPLEVREHFDQLEESYQNYLLSEKEGDELETTDDAPGTR